MPITGKHFWQCHPDDGRQPDKPTDYVPQHTEPCWHCGTETDVGCYCLVCAYYAALVAPGNVYHCKGCDRWWTYDASPSIPRMALSGNA
jgi:hypothetical protein